jgi:lysophospholipid acyltransferase (LPLAT)-like uncharacterized protein
LTATAWSTSPRKRAEVAAISAFGYPLMRALGATWSRKVSGAEHLESISAQGLRPIISLWHGRIFPAVLFFQRRGVVAITSESFDGEWIARIISKFGFGTARGSTTHGGARALLQLVREMKSSGVAFTLDGPRGPAEVARPGAVWLAKATGNPLLPFHAEAQSSWTLNSWDRTQIPKPFTTVAVAIAEPLYVPPDANESSLEEWRRRLEQSLAECRRRSEDMLRR